MDPELDVATALGTYLDVVDSCAPGLVEGLYVVGSFALDDWRPGHSDIDIVAVTAECAQVHVEDKVFDYINAIVRRTREWPQFYLGASPRAGIALVQAGRTLAAFRGRDYVVPDDLVDIAVPALRHRVIRTAEAEVEGQSVDELLSDLIRSVEVPRL